MNRLALGFFIAAVVCFVTFHFRRLPDGGNIHGWEIWPQLVRFFTRGDWRYFGGENGIVIGSLLSMSLMVVTGPLLTPIICQTKLIRGLVTTISFAAMVGFGAILATQPSTQVILWFIVGQALHLLGCLCIRRPQPEEFVPAPHLDS